MPGIRDFILSRASLYEPVHGLQPVMASIKRAMIAFDAFEAERAKIAADANLSPLGKRDKIQKFVTEHAHEIVRVKKAAEKANANMAKRRTNLKLPQIDRTDAAAAAMRSELRNMVSQMSAGERKAFLPTADPMFWQAVLEAPNALTKIDNDTRQMVQSLAIESAHPGALAKIEADSEAIQLLQSTAQVLTEHAAEVAGLPNVKALDELIDTAVPDQRHLQADAERNMSPLLEIASRE